MKTKNVRRVVWANEHEEIVLVRTNEPEAFLKDDKLLQIAHHVFKNLDGKIGNGQIIIIPHGDKL